ncbi:MAG: TIGR04211 family SH3 domain-containing protein [Gammaproteobacteria bacterium]
MRYFKVFAFLALTLSTVVAGAETRYVTDEFKITMRSGESSSHRIVRMLPTGTAVNVVANNPETGYSKVVTPDGREGYVLTRQLDDEPVARDRLVALQERLRELEAAPGELSARLAALQQEHAALQRAHSELQQIKDNIESELTSLQRTAASAVRISNERDDLRKQVIALTRETEDLKHEKRELENSSTQRWFLIGAGVVTGGILLGLILPRLRVRRRRDSWGSL